MDDLVWHLRAVPKELEAETAECKVYAGAMAHEAADEIERLREALDILQATIVEKKPIPMRFKKAILDAHSALQQKESE